MEMDKRGLSQHWYILTVPSSYLLDFLTEVKKSHKLCCFNCVCSVTCHRDESICAQRDWRPADDIAMCAIGWESSSWEAVAAQLWFGESTEEIDIVFMSLCHVFVLT